MSAIAYRNIGIMIFLFALIGTGWFMGNIHATKKYLPQVAALQTKINAADEEAKRLVITQKENEHAVKKSNDDAIASIRSYYKRMLQSVPSQASANPFAVSASGVNAAPSEQSVTGCSLEFERACVLDANKVTKWQEWAIRNHILIEK